jgi:XRE family transcriptional regulator, aerobic/anaerobic benzoate catabolism transcriptional regulator
VHRVNLLVQVGRRVRTLRDQRGWTRRELGERCGLSERFLAQIESGKGNPSLRSVAEIAAAFSLSPASLLSSASGFVALLGLRGAGKSTVGPALAERLARPFIELDDRIEDLAGLALSEIWELHGEATYRELERDALERVLAKAPRAVIATGGGIVTDAATFELLRERTTTVWLKASPELHWQRVLEQGDRRPMANDPRAMKRLRRLLSERGPLYQRAQHAIDTSELSVEAITDRVEQMLDHGR